MEKKPWDKAIPASTARAILELCKINADEIGEDFQLLDFGCGFGRYLDGFSQVISVSQLYGTEVDEERILITREKGFNCYQLDPEKAEMPFEDAMFDVVFSSNVVEHIPRPLYLLYLKEIHRVLKSGGVFFVGAPNYPFKRIYDMRKALTIKMKCYYLFDDPTHVNKFGINQFERDLKEVFQEVNLEPTYLLFQDKIAWLRKPEVRQRLRVFTDKMNGTCFKR